MGAIEKEIGKMQLVHMHKDQRIRTFVTNILCKDPDFKKHKKRFIVQMECECPPETVLLHTCSFNVYHDVLCEWISLQGRRATVGRLVKALRRMKFVNVADMIEDELEVFFAQEDSDSESDIEEDEEEIANFEAELEAEVELAEEEDEQREECLPLENEEEEDVVIIDEVKDKEEVILAQQRVKEEDISNPVTEDERVKALMKKIIKNIRKQAKENKV